MYNVYMDNQSVDGYVLLWLLLLFQNLQQQNRQIMIFNDNMLKKQWQPVVERFYISSI